MYMNVNWLPEIVSKSDVSSVGGQFTLPTQLMILNYPESMNSCLIGWLESDDVTSVMTTIFWKGTLCIRLLSSIEQERNKQIIEYYQEIITLYYLLILVSLVLWIMIIIVSLLCTSVLFKFQFFLFFFHQGFGRRRTVAWHSEWTVWGQRYFDLRDFQRGLLIGHTLHLNSSVSFGVVAMMISQ